MAINFLTTTNTLPEIQINDTGNNPRLELQESGSVSGGISTTGGSLVFEVSSGVEKARILSTGQFLIGHTSYYYAGTYLQVGNTSDNQNGLQITTSTSGDGYILFGDGTGASAYIGQIRYNHTDNFMRFRSNGADAMTIDSSQRVGIGTTSPGQKLEVYGTIKARTAANGAIGELKLGNLSNLLADNGDLFIRNNTTSLVKVTSAGKVGIGTTSPVEKLQINSGDVLINNSTISTLKSGGSLYIDLNTFGSYSGRNFRISDNGTSLVNVKQTGEFGIGTTSPTYKLDVNGSTARIGSSSQTTTTLYLTATDTSGSPATATEVIMQGYEGRAIGTFYQDVTYSGEEWYAGMPYSGAFNYYQIGYDYSGSQAEYAANSLFRVYHNGKTILSTYGSGTHTGTAAKYLAVTSSGEIIETGSGGVLPGGPYLPLAGGTMTGTTRHGDDVVSYWGAGDDLEIYHNSSGDSVIQNHVGDLYFTNKADDKDIIFRTDNGSGGFEIYFYMDGSGNRNVSNKNFRIIDSKLLTLGSADDVQFFHNGTDTFIDNYTGNFTIRQRQDDGDLSFESDNGSGGTAQYLRLDGGITSLVASKDLLMAVDGNGGKIKFGASQDLQIYHDGSNSYITNATADLYIQSFGDDVVIQGADDVDIKVQGGEMAAKFGGNGGVDLYHNNITKFSTTSTGVAITGNADVSGVVYVGSVDSFFKDNNLRFSPVGAAYIDHNIVGQSFIFRTSNSSALDTTALTITSDGYATFGNGIAATNTSFSGTVNIASPIYHIGDTNTWFGFNTADSIQLVTGGSQRSYLPYR